jgi:hypothetical protein
MRTPAQGGDRPWDDPSWAERSDNPWQAGLRWMQARWRATRLGLAPGPFAASRPERLVASTLALDAPHDANFLTPEAAEAARRRLTAGGGGLVKEDRLRRFLLSSQPMCFNLFGHFSGEQNRNALLPWVQTVSPHAKRILRVEIEWAPPPEDHFGGGSAFDAFIEYELYGGSLGFLGVECKYHEDLRKSDVPKVRDVYKLATDESGQWRPGASGRLDIAGQRQFWLNTLLAQSLVRSNCAYGEGRCVVTACSADRSARAAFDAVQVELVKTDELVWQPWETIVAAIDGHEEWRSLFVERYLDFTPIRHLLASGDARRTEAVSG